MTPRQLKCLTKASFLLPLRGAQVSGCGPVPPAYPSVAVHSHSSVWSAVFVTLVGAMLLFLFQFAFCWVVHRRRAQQIREDVLAMRRLLNLLEEGERTTDKYYVVTQPDG